MIYKVGDRIEIIAVIWSLKHRAAKGKVYGRITHINGEYHQVRPMWCKWEVELYRNEMGAA